jgi:hypothetical protein
MKFRHVIAAALSIACVGASGVGFADEVYHYTVRGEVRALPGAGHARNEIVVKHEAIPEYRDETGKVVGMDAMTMPFYLAPGVSADGLKVGDKVELSLESTVSPRFTERVTAVKKITE